MRCEEFRLAAMALAEGETPSVPEPAIQAHLAVCEACRRETEQLRETGLMWQGQLRIDYEVDLWPKIQDRLRGRERYWLALLIVLLAVFKLTDLVPDGSLSLGERFVPVLLTAAIFAVLRQNPFQIETKLV
jgi:predicted anti-sigma-YlaC factor YlaD